MGNLGLTKEQKIKWMTRMYFGVSDTPNHDVNPFESRAEFLEGKVGDLNWGIDKNSSKKSFASRFIQLMELYQIHLDEKQILSVLDDENQFNKDVVAIWAEIAIFS
jgi:hypothetical protein